MEETMAQASHAQSLSVGSRVSKSTQRRASPKPAITDIKLDDETNVLRLARQMRDEWRRNRYSRLQAK
jgi:hypothetical protein